MPKIAIIKVFDCYVRFQVYTECSKHQWNWINTHAVNQFVVHR